MRYSVRHVTTYTYDQEIVVSHHLARITPRVLPRQLVSETRLEINPPPPDLQQFLDCHGNVTHFFSFASPHRQLQVIAQSQVEVLGSPEIHPDSTPAWDTVHSMLESDPDLVLESAPFRFESPQVPRSPMFADFAGPSFRPGSPLLSAALDLMNHIHRDFTYDPEATTISTPVETVLRRKRGVCQDFAHVLLACLRSLDLPARYVSGYLETLPPSGGERLIGADASHAWVSLFCPGVGWIDLDPTNNLMPGDRHITLGWGRDFDDVSPIRGLVVGTGSHSLSVAVDVTPETKTTPAL